MQKRKTQHPNSTLSSSPHSNGDSSIDSFFYNNSFYAENLEEENDNIVGRIATAGDSSIENRKIATQAKSTSIQDNSKLEPPKASLPPGLLNAINSKSKALIMNSNTFNRTRKYLKILNDCRPLKPTLQRLLVSFLFYGVALYTMSVMAVVGGMRYPRQISELPDLGFEILPVLDNQNTNIPNGLMTFAIVATVVRALFHDKGVTMVRRFLVIHGVTALFRCVCLAATSYPDPNKLCQSYRSPETAGAFWLETIIHHGFLTCGDLMFSGHTLIYVLCALTWHKWTSFIEKVVIWILMIGACISLVATHMHYTDDVIIAFYISVTSFYIYHYYAESPILRKKNFIIAWLEQEFLVEELPLVVDTPDEIYEENTTVSVV